MNAPARQYLTRVDAQPTSHTPSLGKFAANYVDDIPGMSAEARAAFE